MNGITTNLAQTFQQYGWVGDENNDLLPSCNEAGHHCVEPADYVEGGISVPSNNPAYPGLVGRDQYYADRETFSLFSGHGGQATLQFRRGTQLADGSNMCYVPFHHDLLGLGSGQGKDARVSAFAASCVGYMDDLVGDDNSEPSDDMIETFGDSASWQYLAFWDSPRVTDGMMDQFVNCLHEDNYLNVPTGTNEGCWREAMTHYTSGENPSTNMPIIFTSGTSSETEDERHTRHENANLLTLEGLPNTSNSTFGQSWSVTASWYTGDPDFETHTFDSDCLNVDPPIDIVENPNCYCDQLIPN